MKIVKVLKAFAWWLVLLVTLTFSLFFALPSILNDGERETPKTVLSLWHVDSFEGGKGSRASFLSKVAVKFEKEHNVVFLISAKTAEGVGDALRKGERPDLISFGVGTEPETLETEAHCWCMGKYVLYSLPDQTAPPTAENTVVSRGGENEPLVSAALEGFSGVMTEADSVEAYVRFLSGKYAYLLGTQRDAQRFLSRGVEVAAKPLNAFTDLKQYIAVTDRQNVKTCEAFISYLLSEEVQSSLTNIGMLSAYYKIYSADQPLVAALEDGKPQYGISPYAGKETRLQIRSAAEGALKGGGVENLKKFLKGS